MKATKWLGLFNTISAYLLPPTAAVVQNNLQSIRPGLLTPRLGLAARLGAQSGNAVLAMYRKTRSKLPDQLVTYSFVRSVSSQNANFTYDYYYAIQRTSQDPISLTYTTTTVYRDDGRALQGFLEFGSPVVVTSDTTGLAIGDRVRGVGVPEDAVIQAIDINKSITLNIEATIDTVANTTQTLQVFPGSVSVPSFAEDRFGRLYTFFGNGIKPQMLRTAQNSSVDIGIESPTAVPNVSFSKASMYVERIDVSSASGGYSEPPKITFIGGAPTISATAVAIISNGAISAVEVTNGGTGYTSAPRIKVDNASRGANFIGTATITSNVYYIGLDFANVVTASPALNSQHTFASSITAGGLPVVTQVGPLLAGSSTVSGSNVVTVTGTNQILQGMTISGTNIPANTIVNYIKSTTEIVISANATATGSSITFTFLNLVTLAYDSTNLAYIGRFPFLDPLYKIAGTIPAAENTGVSAIASIAFAEYKTNYTLTASSPSYTTTGSLNTGGLLYDANYYNATNAGYFGLVASQSSFRWGNWTRENLSRDGWAEFLRGGIRYNGRFRNYWFPNYQFVTVWLHTGTKSSLAKEQWRQVECPVVAIDPTKAYIDIDLYPEQITEGVASPLGLLFRPPRIRVYLAYAPSSWDRTYPDKFDYTTARNAVEYQRIPGQGWLGTQQSFRPVVDFWNSTGQPGTNGWEATSFLITDIGSGINQNATFLLRFASACASHQLGTADGAARINEQTVVRPANSRLGVVEGGWGSNAFDVKFTATTVDVYPSTSLPGAIKTIDVVAKGTGYPATATAKITLRQYLTTFTLSSPDVVCSAAAAVSYQSGLPTDRIDTVTVSTGGAGYASQPTFVIDTKDGSGYGAELSAVINNGVITSVDVIARGHGFTASSAPVITTLATQPDLTAVMRPTFKGVYSCAYRYADWTDTVIGTCYACAVTGGTNQLSVQLDDAGKELIKTGYVLDGGLFRFQTKATTIVGSQIGISRNATNRFSNSTLTLTGLALDSTVLYFYVASAAALQVGMTVTNANIPAGATITAINSLTGGSGAVLTPVVTGTITGILISSGGSGYSTGNTITFAGPGSGATATAIASGGVLTGATITTGGSGYTSASTLTIATGTGAIAVPIVTGVISSVTVTNGGSGYLTAPAIFFPTPGTLATATAILTANVITSVTVSAGGSAYTSTTAKAFTERVDISVLPTATVTAQSLIFGRILPVVQQSGVLALNSPTVTLASTIGLQIGQHVRGAGIPDDTYILAIPLANSSITLSKPATASGTITLQCGWLTTIRDMSLPIAYSNFSPIQTLTAGPTLTDAPTGRLNWVWNANILAPGRAQIVETWRTNGDQSLVFYRTEVWAIATPNSSISPVTNIVAIGATTAANAALLEQNALRGYAAGTSEYDELTDEGLFSFTRVFYAALPVVLPNGGLNAYRFDQPRKDMRVCAAYNDRLWYAVSTSGLDVNTIFFSEYDEFESCPETNALTIQTNQKLTDSLTALMPYGSVLLAAQENHIYQITYSTDPAIDASIALLINRGVYNQRCWDIYDDEIYCLDRRGMYTMTAGGAVISVSDAVQSYWIDKQIEASRTESFFVKIDSRAAVVRAFVVINDSNAPGPNLVLCYSINTKTWWTETYPNSLTSSSSYRPESTQIHDDVYSAIDGTIYALDGQSDAGYRSIVSVALTSGGSGYISPPRVTATSLQGSGAKFQALIKNGVVTDILITDRGTDYGVIENQLGYNGNYLGTLFTSPVGHLKIAGDIVEVQRYTDDTYREPYVGVQSITVATVPYDATATRIPFVANTQSASNNITAVDPTSLAIGQYVSSATLPTDLYITAISGNSVTLSGTLSNTASNVIFNAYAPRTFTAAIPPAWSAVSSSGYVTILADTTAIISQTFNNSIALTIDAPPNDGNQATATAYCQDPPSEYVITGDWVFTVTTSAAPQKGTALITFDTPHPFVRGQQVPIVFTDSDYSLTNNPVHNNFDQNQQAGVPGNWYVKEATANTITVMVKARPNPNPGPMITSGKAQCTAQGLPNQLFTVGLQYKTGAMELVSDDNTPKVGSNFVDRSVTVLYQPTSESRSLILREYYNNSSTPKINQMARNRGTGFIHELNGAQTVLDMASTRSPLGVATGVAKAIFGSRTAGDMSGADTHIAVELIVPSELKTEVDAEAVQPVLYGLTVNGIIEQ